jgi:hypothetical protein
MGSDAVKLAKFVIERLKALNVEFRENSSEEFRAFILAEIEKWGRVAREANIELG